MLLESTFPAIRAGADIHPQKVLTVPDEPKAKSVTYADAGVDISSGDRAKERIKYLAQKTFNRNVLGGIGGFGALFRLDLQRWKNPILVSSADGVGTKLKVAFELGLHQHGGRGPGEPLRERHRRAGRDAAVFSGLPGQRQAGPGGDGERGDAGWPTPARPTAAR